MGISSCSEGLATFFAVDFLSSTMRLKKTSGTLGKYDHRTYQSTSVARSVRCFFTTKRRRSLAQAFLWRFKPIRVGLLGPVGTLRKIPMKSSKSNSIQTSPRSIKKHLDSCVIGQDHAKRVLSVAISNQSARIKGAKIKMAQPELANVIVDKSNILLIGSTGSGKTLLVRTLAKILDLPIVTGDATTLTEAGYVGQDVESLLVDLINAADGDISLAQNGVVYIDEFDKLKKSEVSVQTTATVGGQGVQQALLKMIEGAVVKVSENRNSSGRMHPEASTVPIDTSNIVFICGGAFVGLKEIISQRLPHVQSDHLLRYVTPHDLIKYGIIPELAGRLPVIAAFDSLSLTDFQKILTEPNHAILKQYRKQCLLKGFDIEFRECAIKSMAAAAFSYDIGARGLRSIVETVMLDIQYSAKSGYRYVIDREVVAGSKQAEATKI